LVVIPNRSEDWQNAQLCQPAKKIERQPVIAHEHPAETFVQLGFDGVVSCISAGAHALIGYRPDEVTGANLASFVHPHDRDQLAESWRAVRDGCEQVTCTSERVIRMPAIS
jgi:PAS domain S-box-containing protein